MISVSAGHQFAVNRWNPGYTGGKPAGQAGQPGGQPGGQPSGGPKSAEQATGGSTAQSVASSGGIFCLFSLVAPPHQDKTGSVHLYFTVHLYCTIQVYLYYRTRIITVLYTCTICYCTGVPALLHHDKLAPNSLRAGFN